MWRGNLDRKPYCLIGECPETSSVAWASLLRCLTGLTAQPQLLFCLINQCLLMLALWSCGRRSSVVQAQRQIHRDLLAACPLLYQIRGSSPLWTAALMPAEPHIRSPLQSG